MYQKWKDSKRHDKDNISVHLTKSLLFQWQQYNNDDKTDKSYKIRPVIKHLNKAFAENLLNSPFPSVDEHMFNCMKQHIKSKLIKWGFRQWYRCDSETFYVYQLELYQGRKGKRELNLGSSVVLALYQVLKNIYCHVFFDNFFSSPTLIQKLHDNGLYDLDIARSNRISMPQMKKDKKWSKEITNANFTTTQPVSNGMIKSPWCYSEAIWKK